jgi:hypothetical protein
MCSLNHLINISFDLTARLGGEDKEGTIPYLSSPSCMAQTLPLKPESVTPRDAQLVFLEI